MNKYSINLAESSEVYFQGVLYSLDNGKNPETYAQIPAVVARGDVYHVAFADRLDGKSYIKNTTICPETLKTLSVSEIFYKPKRVGFFDTDGAMPSQFIRIGDKVYLTYNGWNQLSGRPPYLNSSGLIEVDFEDGRLVFLQALPGPFLSRNIDNNSSTVTPWLVCEDECLEFYYIGTDSWEEVDGYFEPRYYVKKAIGQNIRSLKTVDHQVIKPLHSDEVFSRPSIIKINDTQVMAFCSRLISDFRDGANSYVISFAIKRYGASEDWQRTDVFLKPNESWTSKQTCYPFLLNECGRISIFYNGNGFGKSGFGLTRLDADDFLKILESNLI